MDADRILLIDGHSLAFRAFYGAKPSSSFLGPSGYTNSVYGFINRLLSLLKQIQPSHAAAAFDLSRISFRTRQYPEYKAGRKQTPPEFGGQIEHIRRFLDLIGLKSVSKEDFEADDILATFTDRARRSDFVVRIVSGDRDLIQLVDERVTLLYLSNISGGALHAFTPETVFERFGLTPAQYPDMAALVGESSDNLRGLDKIGPKTARKLIQEHGDLETIIARRDSIPGGAGQSLRENFELARRNRRLNTLVRDVEIGLELDELRFIPKNLLEAAQYLEQIGLKTLGKRVLENLGRAQPPSAQATLF